MVIAGDLTQVLPLMSLMVTIGTSMVLVVVLVMLGAYNKLVDMYGGDVVEVIEDQQWREKEWDWIIKSDTT